MKKTIIIILSAVIVISAISIPIILKGGAANNTTNVSDNSNIKDASTVQNSNVKTNDEGNLSIDVIFLNRDNKRNEILQFQVMLNNHMEDLSGLDLSKSVELVNDKGLSIKNGFTWKKEGSGHHVSGILSVENNANGKKILDNNTKTLKLVIKNIGGAKTREFVWQANELK